MQCLKTWLMEWVRACVDHAHVPTDAHAAAAADVDADVDAAAAD